MTTNTQGDLIHGYAGLKDKMGFSKWTAIRMIKVGKFPKPIQLSPRRIGWREIVIDEWLNAGGITK
jgi:predicted DNA-binding transcriptional regulator AlpA